MYGNEIHIKFSMDDGREFHVERGKIDADIGYESHGMFVMKFKFDWGVYTYNSILLERFIEKDKSEPRHYAQDLIKAMLEVCDVDYFSSIQNKEIYILFSERNDPIGLANIHDIQKSLIFDDITAPRVATTDKV
ncbi:hypothetical protein SEA_ATUIN_190 [Arthrobacter phage Atuin]|nr:hypothetical protein SEA_ATUIN_289 [Arthrobacter phage Atuin]